MIKNLSDQLANERTYLAWIRTGIAVMAFGFLVERFNIFLSYIGRTLGNHNAPHGQTTARLIGVGLIAIGILSMLMSTVRYAARDREIKRQMEREGMTMLPAILLGLLLAGLGILLALYLLNIGLQ